MIDSAVILVGGMGTRFQEVSKTIPKGLIPVNGKPFLLYLLDQLIDTGIKHATLCIGHLADSYISHLGGSYKGLKLLYSNETTPLGTAGAIRNAFPERPLNKILVLNGDSLCPGSLNNFVADGKKSTIENIIFLVAAPADEGIQRFGNVLVEGDKIISFLEKETNGKAGYINAGIYILSPEFIDKIAVGKNISLEKEIFPHEKNLMGYMKETNRSLYDIGTTKSYAKANEDFKIMGL